MKKIELLITSVLLLVIIVIVGIFSINFKNSTYGLYSELSFWENVLVEAHGMILDLFFVGVVLIFILSRIEKKKEIKEFHNKIEFNRHMKSEASKYTILSVIGLLNEEKVSKFDLHQCNLSNLIMTRINISGSSIHATNFSGTNLKNSNFTKINGERTILDRANINNVDFSLSRLYRVEMNETIARGSKFKDCEIIRTCFADSDFNNVDFRKSRINNSNFKNSILRNADFRECEFGDNVTFRDADLRSANFIGSKNLNLDEIVVAKSINKAKFDQNIVDELRQLDATLVI